MFQKLEHFTQAYENESKQTLRLFANLDDAKMNQAPPEIGRSSADVARHIAASAPGMFGAIGIQLPGPAVDQEIGADKSAISQAYAAARDGLFAELPKHFTDENLGEPIDFHGYKWPRGLFLAIFMNHEIHHRGQLTILMRLAGMTPVGVYGPTKEEMEAMQQAQ